MSNTVVYGKAAPLQVAGQLSNGYFFQNLGTQPVYVGYNTGVSAGNFDGVIQPGGTYNSGPNRAVWLYADYDTPVVYNDDGGASADAGSQVTATGAVSINGTVPVAQQGAVAISGTVPITAPGTLPVAQQGKVDTTGSSVLSTPNDTYAVIANNLAVSLTGSGSLTLINQFVTAGARVVILDFNGDATNNDLDFLRLGLNWVSPSGIGFFENYLIWARGRTNIVVPVKGDQLRIYGTRSTASPGVTLTGELDVRLSTIEIPEVFVCNPFSNNARSLASTNIATNILQADLSNGAVQEITVTGSALGSCSAWFALPVMAGRITGLLGGGGGGYSGDYATISLYHGVWNINPIGLTTSTTPALLAYAKLKGPDAAPVSFEFEVARSFLLLYVSLFNSTAANAVVANLSMTYERLN